MTPRQIQIFGENACHPEPMRFAQGKLREGAGEPAAELLSAAKDDSQGFSTVALIGSKPPTPD